jgi:hypothetical protein
LASPTQHSPCSSPNSQTENNSLIWKASTPSQQQLTMVSPRGLSSVPFSSPSICSP